MNKRGISDLLVILLFIILILISLIFLYNITKFFLQEQGEIAEIKAELISTRMSVRAVEGDLNPPQSIPSSIINVSISIDKGLEHLKNLTLISISKAADVFLLADISRSMLDVTKTIVISNQTRCRYNCTYSTNPASNLSCPTTNWTELNPGCKISSRSVCINSSDVCHINRTILSDSNRSVITQTEQWYCRYRWYNPQNCTPVIPANVTADRNCVINLSTQSCTLNACNYFNCNTPGTIFYNNSYRIYLQNITQDIYKINISRAAAKNFTDAFLNFSNKKLGIIPFSTTVNLADIHDLSSSIDSLKANIDKWNPTFTTCTCCAINEASQRLINPNNIKAMILISDGNPTETCDAQGTGDPQSDAVKAAQEAFSRGIKVYAIGFGVNEADTNRLKEIAEAGNGSYYSASDADELVNAYNEIITQISKEYELATNLKIAVIFSNEKQSFKYLIDDPPLRVFESKKYSIEIPTAQISDIKKIEIYPVLYTKAGREIVGPLLSVWKSD